MGTEDVRFRDECVRLDVSNERERERERKKTNKKEREREREGGFEV